MIEWRQVLVVGLNVGSAFCAFAAALFWFLSAKVKVPPVDYTWAGLSVERADDINAAMSLSACRNRLAAIWAGVSALLAAAATVTGI